MTMKKPMLILVVLGLVCTTAMAAISLAGDQRKAIRLNQDGAAAMQRNHDYKKAGAKFQDALRQDPTYAAPLFNLAVLSKMQGDAKTALGYLHEYIHTEKNPERRLLAVTKEFNWVFEYHKEAAKDAMARGAYWQALSHLATCHRMEPKNSAVLLGICAARLAMNDVTRAADALAKARKLPCVQPMLAAVTVQENRVAASVERHQSQPSKETSHQNDKVIATPFVGRWVLYGSSLEQSGLMKRGDPQGGLSVGINSVGRLYASGDFSMHYVDKDREHFSFARLGWRGRVVANH